MEIRDLNDEEHVHVPSYNKGYEDSIKEVEKWITSIRDARPHNDGKSIGKFIHKKCLESPLNDVEVIVDVVGLMAEFYHLPMMSMIILKEIIELEKIKRNEYE